MKASENTFELNAVLAVTLDSSDNDGLIFVPKNSEINVIKPPPAKKKFIS